MLTENASPWGKVAEVTLVFWILKIIATTLGEMSGDYLAQTLDLGYVAGLAITTAILVAAVWAQVSSDQYQAPRFWIAIVATTMVGTEISDMMDRTLGLGYTWGSLMLFGGLLATLWVWYKREGNLRIHPLTHKGAELTFWLAVLFSNSLGTAFGDYMVDVIGLGYGQGAIVTITIIGAVFLLHHKTSINPVALFWVAFVFTRPFGATFGDFLTKPLAKGGLDLGTLEGTLVSMTLMTALVWFSTHRANRLQRN